MDEVSFLHFSDTCLFNLIPFAWCVLVFFCLHCRPGFHNREMTNYVINYIMKIFIYYNKHGETKKCEEGRLYMCFLDSSYVAGMEQCMLWL